MPKNSNLVTSIVNAILKVSNVIYLCAAVVLALLSLLLILVSGYNVYEALFFDTGDISLIILDAIGLIVISIAIFDVGKYILEEEVSRDKELRSPHEARKTLTKFIVIIFIAVALESLVHTFIASKQDVKLIVFPAILLISATVLIIGLGIYQKLSVQVEQKISNNK